MKLETIINEIYITEHCTRHNVLEHYNISNKMYDNCHKRTKEKKLLRP